MKKTTIFEFFQSEYIQKQFFRACCSFYNSKRKDTFFLVENLNQVAQVSCNVVALFL